MPWLVENFHLNDLQKIREYKIYNRNKNAQLFRNPTVFGEAIKIQASVGEPLHAM